MTHKNYSWWEITKKQRSAFAGKLNIFRHFSPTIIRKMVRLRRIELRLNAYRALVLPLNYNRIIALFRVQRENGTVAESRTLTF